MKLLLTMALCYLALLSTGSAQVLKDVFSQRETLHLPNGIGQATPVAVQPNVVQSIVQERPTSISLSLPSPLGVRHNYTLQRMQLTNATSRLTIMSDKGAVHSPLGQSMVWYRSTQADGSMAVFTFDVAGNVSGFVDSPNGRYSVGRMQGSSDPAEYVVAFDQQQVPSCYTTDKNISDDIKALCAQAAEKVKHHAEKVQSTDTIEMEIAVEADYQMRQKVGNRAATASYVTQLMAILSTIFERDLAVKFTVTNVRIWDTSADPYSDNVTVFGGLLDEFVAEYRNNMKSVHRDLAMLLTSRYGNGGIARSIGGICEEDASYCAGDTRGSLEPGLSGFTWDIFMMAHEIGHVCGGLHTQSCIWPGGPLDSCVASEDGACVSYDKTRPTRGTIMSYCHQQLNSGATMVYEFHPLSRNVVRAYIERASCLTARPPNTTGRMHGYLTDATTGLPIVGSRLTLGRYQDHIVRQVPSVNGDTVAVTGPNGYYEFTGISMGIYYVQLEEGLVPHPVVWEGNTYQNPVQVADSVTRFDLVATRGYRVEVLIASRDSKTPFTLNVFSNNFEFLFRTVKSPSVISRKNDSTYSFLVFAPYGSYIIVPSAPDYVFTPPKFTIDIQEGVGASSTVFKATGLLNKGAITIALGFGDMPAWPAEVPAQLFGGLPYKLRDLATRSVINSGVIPDDGVLVLERTPNASNYLVDVELDTVNKASYLGGGYIYPLYQNNSTIMIQQDRRRPYLARSYRMTERVDAFTSLANPTVVHTSSSIIKNSASVELPFPIRVLDRTLTTLQIARNGFVSFGSDVTGEWEEDPLGQSTRSPLVISAFGKALSFDTLSTSHVGWTVEGSTPNRIVKVEWKNMVTTAYIDDDYYQPVTVGPLTLQIHVHENGNIDVVYAKPDSLQYKIGTIVGLRGNDVMDNSIVQRDPPSTVAGFVYGPTPLFEFLTPQDIRHGMTFHWELLPTSVHQEWLTTPSLQPTPASESVVLTGLDGVSDIRIVDMLGATVYTSHLPTSHLRVDVRSMPTGRYSVLIRRGKDVAALTLVVVR